MGRPCLPLVPSRRQCLYVERPGSLELRASIHPFPHVEGDAGNWDPECLRSRPDVRPLLAGHIRDHKLTVDFRDPELMM